MHISLCVFLIFFNKMQCHWQLVPSFPLLVGGGYWNWERKSRLFSEGRRDLHILFWFSFIYGLKEDEKIGVPLHIILCLLHHSSSLFLTRQKGMVPITRTMMMRTNEKAQIKETSMGNINVIMRFRWCMAIIQNIWLLLHNNNYTFFCYFQ